jgi:hypothetical protein
MSGLTFSQAGQLQNQYGIGSSAVEKYLWHTASCDDVSILGWQTDENSAGDQNVFLNQVFTLISNLMYKLRLLVVIMVLWRWVGTYVTWWCDTFPNGLCKYSYLNCFYDRSNIFPVPQNRVLEDNIRLSVMCDFCWTNMRTRTKRTRGTENPDAFIRLNMQIVRVAHFSFITQVERQLCIVDRGYAIVTKQQWGDRTNKFCATTFSWAFSIFTA